jgi:hypothetical protein
VSAAVRLAAFGGVLAALVGGGAVAGAAFGPEPTGQDQEAAHGQQQPEAGHGAMAPTPADDRHGGHEAGTADVHGLAVAQDGLRLVVDDADLPRGRQQMLRFRVVDEAGSTVRNFDVQHTKRMHLILARRDLSGFQHLHPLQGTDGTWSVPVTIPDAGSYRMFADFSHDEQAMTLASDLRVDGAADLADLPAPSASVVSDGGFDVGLDASDARAGRDAQLHFTVTKHGRPVHTVPYLGAGGHLVALREGDMAFLHVHPQDHPTAGTGPGISFAAMFPTQGRYRLFLQYQVGGRVQTAAFTQEVSR